MIQGWIMRRFDLRTISVETAGQSGPGSLISLMGIRDTERSVGTCSINAIRMNSESPSPTTAPEGSTPDPVLVEIRDSLQRTTQLLEELVQQGRTDVFRPQEPFPSGRRSEARGQRRSSRTLPDEST